MVENDPFGGSIPEVLDTPVEKVHKGDSVADSAEGNKDPDNDSDNSHRRDHSDAKDGSDDDDSTPDSVDTADDPDNDGDDSSTETDPDPDSGSDAKDDGDGDDDTPDYVDTDPDEDDSRKESHRRTAMPSAIPPGYHAPTEQEYENWEMGLYPDQRTQGQRQSSRRKRADEERQARLHPGP